MNKDNCANKVRTSTWKIRLGHKHGNWKTMLWRLGVRALLRTIALNSLEHQQGQLCFTRQVINKDNDARQVRISSTILLSRIGHQRG